MYEDYLIRKQLKSGKHAKRVAYFRRQVNGIVSERKKMMTAVKARKMRKAITDLILEAYFAGLDEIKESKNGTQKS